MGYGSDGHVLAYYYEAMPRCPTFAALLLASSSLGACAHLGATPKNAYATPQMRRAAIQRAQVWAPTDVPSMDLMTGPQGPGAYAPNATIDCHYLDKKISGRSPKFACVIPPDDELKVKYGRHNGEVYAEVAAARLFWALGFGAERMYPVRVVCTGCPSAILHDTDLASVERKMPGTDIDTPRIKGWAWPELDQVEPAAGGAPRAQRDALKLLATLIQHTDSKPEQQRLICMPEHADQEVETKAEAKQEKKEEQKELKKEEKKEEKGKEARKGVEACADTFMMVHDLGQTFGHANVFNRSSVGSVNLREWSHAPVWQDPARCIAYLPKSNSGSLENPRISEEGRQFLADLLAQLTDAQLHDLFEVARFPQRWDPTENPENAATVEQWVDAFKKKRDEVMNHQCVSQR
jgi:hypothetical protein